MTLPPRLTDRTFPPDPERAHAILATARWRRRAQASTVGLGLAAVVGVAALGGPGGAASLQPVEPAPTESGSPVPAPAPSGSPSASPAGQPGQPGASATPSPEGTPAVEPTATPPAVALTSVETVSRSTKAYDAFDRCTALASSAYTARETPDTAEWCFRWSWPAEVAEGEPVTFTVDQCALDADVTARWDDRPTIWLRHALYWHSDTNQGPRETLRARTCWTWTLRWNAVVMDDGRERRLPPGTYDVEVFGAGASELTFTAFHHQDPDRQTTLVVR